MSNNDHLSWIDSEPSGLDPLSDSIIEIGTIVTGSGFNVIAEGPWIAERTARWPHRTSAQVACIARLRRG